MQTLTLKTSNRILRRGTVNIFKTSFNTVHFDPYYIIRFIIVIITVEFENW